MFRNFKHYVSISKRTAISSIVPPESTVETHATVNLSPAANVAAVANTEEALPLSPCSTVTR